MQKMLNRLERSRDRFNRSYSATQLNRTLPFFPKTEFDNLIKKMDDISENFMINCGSSKIPIPVNDFSLDPVKVDEWVNSHKLEYKQLARTFIDKFVKHVSYKQFVKKCIETM